MTTRSFTALFLALTVSLLTSCATTTKGPYNAKAYRPTNQSDVRVKVSLSNRMVYVMEGNRPLLVTPTAIGKPESPTPLGNYKVFQKIEKKRSNTYGYAVTNNGTYPVKRTKMPRGAKYVGFPMPYWVEFKSGYGFHTGSVWPTPRSHGCLRLHANVAPKFFALVPVGTPVNIANSQPEDATIGKNVPRPTDYADPDPPISVMTSPAAFPAPKYPLFEN